MDLTFTAPQLALRAEVSQFLAAERAAGSFTPQVDAWITGFDREFTKRMAARGWIGLT
jgi:acyl-CoA dehydrogenase